MKKLYNGKGKKIYPSPPPSSPCDILAALPATILTLAAALSPEEKEVLAYLLSIAGQDKVAGKNTNHHPPELGCGCFACYKSFWARWDASPNRHLIHHILDGVEESVEPLSLPSGLRRRRFKRHTDFKEEGYPAAEVKAIPAVEDGKDKEFEEEEEEEEEKNNEPEALAGANSPSTVRRFVSFIGERVWGVWNH